jgi:hypothetical protein
MVTRGKAAAVTERPSAIEASKSESVLGTRGFKVEKASTC